MDHNYASTWNNIESSIMSNIKLKPPERSRGPGNFFVQANTRILYEYGTDKKLLSEDFMDIFCSGGSLHHMFDNIWSWESPFRGTYQICFKEINQDVKDLENMFSKNEVVDFKLRSGKTIMVKFGFPWQPVHHLTLRGVPTEYSLSELKKRSESYGLG